HRDAGRRTRSPHMDVRIETIDTSVSLCLCVSVARGSERRPLQAQRSEVIGVPIAEFLQRVRVALAAEMLERPRRGDRSDLRRFLHVPDKFTASFFCSTDTENNQIASFYIGAMANASEMSLRTIDSPGLVI